MFRRSRETMIALRARHEAFRIAAEIGQPQMEPPAQPQPVLPLLPPPPPEPDWWAEREPALISRYVHYDVSPFASEAPPPQSRRQMVVQMVGAILMILGGMILIVMAVHG